jgi:predicted dehydrogenase
MILAKCCHDLDLLVWFIGEPVTYLSSYGSLRHFRSENAPQGAPRRCTDGCPVENNCPFYAPMIYIELEPFKSALSHATNPIFRLTGSLSLRYPQLIKTISKIIPPLQELTEYEGLPRSAISADPANEDALLKALKEGPYGRCVYYSDNDVVDHQEVTMEFQNGITGTLTMHGHSHEESRTLRIDGSRASLLAKFSFHRSFIEIHDHRSMEIEVINFPSNAEQVGHGGGDFGIMQDFVSTMKMEKRPQTRGRESFESHLMAFAAEESRHHRKMINMSEFRAHAETKG